MTQHSAYLRDAGFAAHAAHLVKECTRLGEPLTGVESGHAAVVTELHRQRSGLCCSAKQFAMQCSRLSPGWLAACGGVEGEDQARLALGDRLNGPGLSQERRDVARAGAVKIFWNGSALGRAGREQAAIAELAKIVASACQLGDHCVERLLVQHQPVTVAFAADQFHEFAA